MQHREEIMGPVRVLITDPDPTLAGMYRQALERYGFAVATACNGLECLARLRDFQPEVLVMDSEIRWGQAEGVLAVIRSEPEFRSILVILLSADKPLDAAERLAGYPVREWDIKPVMPKQLAERIWRLLNSTADELAPAPRRPDGAWGRPESGNAPARAPLQLHGP